MHIFKHPYDSGASVLATSGSFGPIIALHPTTASSFDNTMNSDGPLKTDTEAT